MDIYGMQWWEKEQERKKKASENFEANNINRQLNNMIQKLRYNVVQDESVYEEYVRFANSRLVQCSIWDITYRNNMENPIVGVLQYYLALAILIKDGGEENEYMLHELRRLRNRLELSFNVRREFLEYRRFLTQLGIDVHSIRY